MPNTATWTRINQSTAVESGVSHACLSNLVIFTEALEDAPLIDETIAQFVVKHPCRVIVIKAQPRHAESKIEADYSPRTFVTDTGKSGMCDQITLNAFGSSVRELAAAVQPLLVPDLPIYVWWRGMFLQQRALVEQMLAYADRFIYDGANWTNLHYTVVQVSDLVERFKETVGFTNFNWSRLRPWRENTAAFFDTGLFDKQLGDIQRLRVEYMALPGMEEGFEFRALLFVAWMAGQLEWQPARGVPGAELARLQFNNKKGATVDAELVLLPQSASGAQSIQRVTISLPGQELGIERDHKDHLEVLTSRGQNGVSVLRKVPHADSSVADLLYRELGRRGRNRVFEKSFKLASELLQMI
jgi:glucose-6-phosphate dehydrogenase assembly protein OpcA